MDLEKFNEYIGWDSRAEVVDCSWDGVQGCEIQDWWQRITYVLPLDVGALLLSRQDLGKMSDQELHLLWRASEGRRFLDQSNPTNKVNLGYLLATRMLTIKQDTRVRRPIQLGGIVTWLTYKL